MNTNKGYRKGVWMGTLLMWLIGGSFIVMWMWPTIAAEREAQQRQAHFDQLLDDWGTQIRSDPQLQLYSSYGGYTNKEAFEQIRSLGPEYLPLIMREIETGLYLTALIFAAQNVSQATIRHPNGSPSGWLDNWYEHVAAAPAQLEMLRAQLNADPSNRDAYIASITELGIPALLPLLRHIAAGDLEMIEPVRKLLSGHTEFPDSDEASPAVWRKWAKQQLRTYRSLKDL